MKNFYRITVLIALLTISGLSSLHAQRTISGTVYNNGKPAEGAILQVDLGGSMMTSSDGKYQLVVQDSSQWLNLFSLINPERMRYPIQRAMNLTLILIVNYHGIRS